jgi:formylmethanofuran:tetrahydromethanopterin formyltransferase
MNNIISEARERNGQVVSYKLRPADGYKLHEKLIDQSQLDDAGNETGKIKCGYTTGFVTVGANYDWEANPRKIYAIPIDAEDEIIDKEMEENEETDTLKEKAKAYDIITGVAE